MALSKVNFNSMNVTPAASKAIKFNSSNNGLETGDIGGSLVLISTTTASNSATVSITSGIDSTYKEYVFTFKDIHPSNDNVDFYVNASVDGGSNYNATKTTTYFRAGTDEGDRIQTNEVQTSLDAITTDTDKLLLELGSFSTVTEATEIDKVFLRNKGQGYKALPTVSVTSTAGTGAKILALTNDIGAASNIVAGTARSMGIEVV